MSGWPLVVTSDSPAATKDMAGRLAALCARGTSSCLMGDLGAGKTAFAQGFAAALGLKGPVTSPTFALVRQYRCAESATVTTLIHADVYRTGGPGEVVELALAELVEERAIALVEWGELAASALGDDALDVLLELPDAELQCRPPTGWTSKSARSASRVAGVGPDGREEVTRALSLPLGWGCSVNIVAIETATETIGVAARTDSGARAAFTLSGRRRHVETLVPALEDVLAQLELGVSDLDLVAVDLGPGLFTGLRVGVAAAKGLAQALGIGIIGLSSLDILTRAADRAGPRRHCIGGDRRPAR